MRRWIWFYREALTPRRDFQFRADVIGHLGGIIVNEVAEAMMRDAAELGPRAEGSD